MSENVKTTALGGNVEITHEPTPPKVEKSPYEVFKNLYFQWLSFFRKPKATILMEDYEVVAYFIMSDDFEDEVRCRNGYIFGRLKGNPSMNQILGAMNPTGRDFELEGNQVIVKIESIK